MRLIDADALIAEIDKRLYDETCPFPAEITEALDMIDEAPTIDPTQKLVVVPSEVIKQVADCIVNTINNIDWSKAIDAYKEINNEKPKGRWIYHKSPSESRECSNCGVWLDWSLVRNSFCPNCGADMRGEGK